MESVVEVGGYVLEPGDGGTGIRSHSDAANGSARPLQRAFAEPAAPKEADPALATEVDAASQATAKIERAVALCKGIGEGRALDPTQLALEVGALLDCLERLDRKKEHKKSIQMARALATLLMLLKRWADLLQTLRTAVRAGEKLGDLDAIAWAEHELGTLRLAAGDVADAERSLHQAQAIRERIGDRRGLAATERNLGVLCERLRQMLRQKELVQREGRRSPTPRLALFAVLLAIAFATAGFAVGSLTDDSSDPGQPTTVENASRSDGNPPVTDPGGDEPSTYEPDSPTKLGD
ncbi:MAG TPA: tetratricopeptide repeat protein [Solirubrobacterales bacterium]|nr:tetratricopeptide repeat protein [Solirubrobacterales bacterium]